MINDSAAQTLDDQTPDPEDIESWVRLAADAAWDKKALGLKALDVRGRVSYADYLIICSGTSERQVGAIADSVQSTLRENRKRPLGTEGSGAGSWILLDYGDFVVHVFSEAERDVYGLDSLWVEAPSLALDAPEGLERPAYY